MLKLKILPIYFLIFLSIYAGYMHKSATFIFRVIVPATFTLDRYTETIDVIKGRSYITPVGQGINFLIYGGFSGDVDKVLNSPFDSRKVKFSVLGGDGNGGFELDGVKQNSSLPDLKVGVRGRGSYGDPISVRDFDMSLAHGGYRVDQFEIAFKVNEHKEMVKGSYSTKITLKVQYY